MKRFEHLETVLSLINSESEGGVVTVVRISTVVMREKYFELSTAE